MNLELDTWTEIELGRNRTRLDLPVGNYAALWLQYDAPVRVRLELIAAEDGSAPDMSVEPGRGFGEVRVRRGELMVSAEKKCKCRVKVATRQGRE